MNVTAADLDAFVAEVDELGGPGPAASSQRWQSFRYVPAARVDVSLDPDGEAYFDQMIALYEEISGRKLDQSVTELTPLDAGRLVPLESPYADTSPTERTVHYLRLARAFRQAELPKGGRVLDMGCGWGLSSEFIAQLGFFVDAVDINPLFTDLVRRRADRLSLPIRTWNKSFDDFEAEPCSFDAVVFYECLHHAVRPSPLLARIRTWLKPEGKLILAGEPIQELYWPNWGLRLDPLSVYCIRKFGWFESGWSARYLQQLIARAGMTPFSYSDPDPVIGPFVVGLRQQVLNASAISRLGDPAEWWLEGEYLISGRSGKRSTFSCYCLESMCLEVFSFKPDPQKLRISIGTETSHFVLTPGRNEIRLTPRHNGVEVRCELFCKPWCPDDLLHNGDRRHLGFHLKSISFE